ncbi:hypothetical protein Tco_0911760 [Tanacetum coccineum]|uniref:Uncharacterized protein n=1 Tax=Tanacetum coccineum TaxID=301880 RepID=A0ABQ5CWM3_9ASTR
MRRLIRSENERLEVRRNFRSRKTIRGETTTRREKKRLGVRRIVYEFETRRMRDVRTKTQPFRWRCFLLDIVLKEMVTYLRALQMFIEQLHDEVYGCLKGSNGNSEGKKLVISMVEEAWLSEKEEISDHLISKLRYCWWLVSDISTTLCCKKFPLGAYCVIACSASILLCTLLASSKSDNFELFDVFDVGLQLEGPSSVIGSFPFIL